MLTAAAAFTLSIAYSADFRDETAAMFSWICARARRCPMIDCLDVFCDAMEEWQTIPSEERAKRVKQLFEDISFASQPLGGGFWV